MLHDCKKKAHLAMPPQMIGSMCFQKKKFDSKSGDFGERTVWLKRP